MGKGINTAVDQFVRNNGLSVSAMMPNMSHSWNASKKAIAPLPSHLTIGVKGVFPSVILGDGEGVNHMSSMSSHNSFEQLILICFSVAMMPLLGDKKGWFFIGPDISIGHMDSMDSGLGGWQGLGSVQPNGMRKQYARPISVPDYIYAETERSFLSFSDDFCLPDLPGDYFSKAAQSVTSRQRLNTIMQLEIPFFQDRYEADMEAFRAKYPSPPKSNNGIDPS